MSFPICVLVTAAVSYLLGCTNGAIIISKYILKDDIRGHGSGNAGLTNFYRVFGGKLTAAVIGMDVLKVVLAVLFGAALFGRFGAAAGYTATHGKYVAGLCCLIGHMYPCMFGFQGGKGILSGGFMALMIDWRVALIAWGGFFILAIATKYVSLGSVYAGASYPFASWLCFHDSRILLLAAITGALIVWRHKGNIRRLLRGEESKFAFHKKAGGTK